MKSNFLLKLLLPMLISTAKESLVLAGQEWHDKHPDTFKQLLTAIYPVIDVQLETYAKETKSKVDDQVAQKLKEVCEELAAANEISLPNLDND